MRHYNTKFSLFIFFMLFSHFSGLLDAYAGCGGLEGEALKSCEADDEAYAAMHRLNAEKENQWRENILCHGKKGKSLESCMKRQLTSEEKSNLAHWLQNPWKRDRGGVIVAR